MKHHDKKAGWSAERAGRLDNPERRAVLPPEQTLLKLGLKSGMVFADIGCGVGYFTLPAAKIIGPDAKAYAADVSAEMLDILLGKAADLRILNIEAVLSDEYDFKLESGAADFALCSNVLHEIEDEQAFVREIARILAPGGTMAVIEWKMLEGEKGPTLAERIPPDALAGMLGRAGLKDFQEMDINADLYAMVAKKE